MESGDNAAMRRRSLLKTGAAATTFGMAIPTAQAKKNGLTKELTGAKAVYEIESIRKENGETTLSQTRRVEVTISEHSEEEMITLQTEIFDNDELEQKDEYSTHISRILSPVSGTVTKRGPVEITSKNGLITQIERSIKGEEHQSNLNVSLVESTGFVGVGTGQALHLLPTFVGMFGGTPVVQPRVK